jgi:D-alanyl-lipoteichoic acid acyltransferase DltB (MBOAT superfamily)
LFVTFFPHLVAGPIVRPPQLVPQFEKPRKATRDQLLEGLFLLTLGLFMKVVLADSMLSGTADTIFNATDRIAPLDAWMGVLAFSGQIFFDFAGYSTCAVGVAACLGFVLPQNFLYPYAAIGFSDFWRRWHITLSAWLRDYLYIPLGGNRKGRFRTYLNLMITMLLGGLWHGANWTFVVWGGLHGFYLWVEKAIADIRKDVAKPIAMTPAAEIGVLGPLPEILKPKTLKNFAIVLFTFFLINVTWVFFRSPSFSKSWHLLSSMFGQVHNGNVMLTTLAIIKVSVIISLMVIFHWIMRNTKVLEVAKRTPWWLLGLTWSVLLLLLIWSQESSTAFIYFQF